MDHRNLRVAWSAAWTIGAVLLLVLWFRSYRYFNDELKYIDSSGRGWYLDSLKGGAVFVTSMHDPTDPDKWRLYGAWEHGPLGLGRFTINQSSSFRIPYWFSVVVAAVFAITPCCVKRFSLRTLLIATTLAAVVLALIVWLR
jgi:hypothetical protein